MNTGKETVTTSLDLPATSDLNTSHDSQQSSPSIISVRNLSKKYQLYDSHIHRLKEALHPFRKKFHRDFWALKGVSFDIKAGETVGIVGKNGSGKSTLLQLICGIIHPTTGEVRVNGRVSALLELGAGFNREFTGRENVYMNGALMGFTKKEIAERFQSIAEFADIGDFIGQPVKTYSSGMYVRLAFAVAINVDPDILIIDEALSVGDMAFQAKCMDKIKKMIDSGVTLIFVSHDPGAIKSICGRAMWLTDGTLKEIGEPERVLNQYLKDIRTLEVAQGDDSNRGPTVKIEEDKEYKGYGSGDARIEKVFLTNSDGEVRDNFTWGESLTINVISQFFVACENYCIGFLIRDIYGNDLYGTNLKQENTPLLPINENSRVWTTFSFKIFFQPGIYKLTVAVNLINQENREILCDWSDNIALFKVNKASFKIPETKVYIPAYTEVRLIP